MSSNNKNNTTQKKNNKKTQQKKMTVSRPNSKPKVRSAIDSLVHQIAIYLSAPGEPGVKGFRWASEFSQQDTALAEPFAIIQPNFGETAALNAPYLDAKQGLIVLFRGVECAAIVYDQNAGLAVKTYDIYMKSGTTIDKALTLELPVFGEVPLITPYAKTNDPTQWSPHGNTLYAGSVRGTSQRFLWVDEGDTVEIIGHLVVGASANIVIVADRYDSRGLNPNVKNTPVTFTNVDGAPAIIKSNGDPAGYYAFRFENGEALDLDLAISSMYIQGDGACMAHLPLPDFEKNWLRESGVRINALSAMYSNTSTVNDLGGTVSGCQFGSKTDWLDLLQTDVVTYIQSRKGSMTTDVRRGLHGFLKPTQPEDFKIQAYSEIDSTEEFVDSFYPLDERGSFLAIGISLPGAGKGNEGYVTLRYGIEYLTQDTWASTTSSDIPDEVFKHALGYLKNLQQFHENPNHMKELWSKITSGAKKAFSFLTNEGPQLLNGVKQNMEILSML